jgi:hypothetical protein
VEHLRFLFGRVQRNQSGLPTMGAQQCGHDFFLLVGGWLVGLLAGWLAGWLVG